MQDPNTDKKAKKLAKNPRSKYLHWQKLDNSAHLFPAIAGEKMTNTYRIACELKEEVDGACLQEALDCILPKFRLFNLRLRHGFFWYYLEENGRKAPRVVEENTYPCRYINTRLNQHYLFRVSYYKKRINLEVFHVLTDGTGAINFLKELIYQYLRHKHEELGSRFEDRLSVGTSMNIDDSFLRNYKKKGPKKYASARAFQVKGRPHLRDLQSGIMHFKMDLAELKKVTKSYGLTVNEYLVSCYTWGIYKAYLNGSIPKKPIRISVPVNLCSYYESNTTTNFFVMISAEFHPQKEDYCFEEVAKLVSESLRSQYSKEHLEEIFSYNVSNQKNPLLRILPLWGKSLGIRAVYNQSARANTSTMSNVGIVSLEEAYAPYVENFHVILAMSVGTPIRAAICSYQNHLTVAFSSSLREAHVQRFFAKQLVADGLDVTLETNGVYYGQM